MKNSLVCHMEKSKSWQDKLINFKWASGVLRVEIRVDDAVFPPHVCLKVSLLWQPSLWKICKLCKEKKNRIWLILHFRLLQMNNRRCDNFSQMSSAKIWKQIFNTAFDFLQTNFSPLQRGTGGIALTEMTNWRISFTWNGFRALTERFKNSSWKGRTQKACLDKRTRDEKIFSKNKIHKHPPTSFMNNNADVTRNENVEISSSVTQSCILTGPAPKSRRWKQKVEFRFGKWEAL